MRMITSVLHGLRRAWEPIAEATVQVVGQVHPHQHPRGGWVDRHVVLSKPWPQGPWKMAIEIVDFPIKNGDFP